VWCLGFEAGLEFGVLDLAFQDSGSRLTCFGFGKKVSGFRV
jgi:hypothetical protein